MANSVRLSVSAWERPEYTGRNVPRAKVSAGHSGPGPNCPPPGQRVPLQKNLFPGSRCIKKTDTFESLPLVISKKRVPVVDRHLQSGNRSVFKMLNNRRTLWPGPKCLSPERSVQLETIVLMHWKTNTSLNNLHLWQITWHRNRGIV